MKLTVVAVGKLRDAWVREGCEEYERRIRRYLPLEVVEVKTARDVAARLPARQRLVVLDEGGREPTSKELAVRLSSWMNSGLTGVTFVVGGAEGVLAETMAHADEKLSLSRLTLPHRIARLVLLEQLYRALSIVRGEPYHRG